MVRSLGTDVPKVLVKSLTMLLACLLDPALRGLKKLSQTIDGQHYLRWVSCNHSG